MAEAVPSRSKLKTMLLKAVEANNFMENSLYFRV
jgi:hypothetical protein